MNTELEEEKTSGTQYVEPIEGYAVGFILPKSGFKCFVREGKGKDAEKAMTAQSEKHGYLTQLMRLLAVVDEDNGQGPLPMRLEEIADMKMSDYQALLTEFSKVNF